MSPCGLFLAMSFGVVFHDCLGAICLLYLVFMKEGGGRREGGRGEG